MKFVGEEKIAALVKTDLSQLKVVPYYGCLLGRPSELTGEMRQRAAHDDGPAAAGRRRGRQVVELQDRVLRRQRGHAQDGDPAAGSAGKILEQALAAGADAIVVRCPLCHVNLDLKQAQINSYLGTDYNVPILYLSQVLGLAFGLSADDVHARARTWSIPSRSVGEGHRTRRRGSQGRGRAQGGREGRQGRGEGGQGGRRRQRRRHGRPRRRQSTARRPQS